MNKKYSVLHLPFLVLLYGGLVSVGVVFANAPTGDDVFNLSLEALSRITVQSSSVSEKTLVRAPNIVSIVTAKQIKASGANTLTEALQYLPGVQFLHRRNGRDMLWIRGIPSGRNSKTLLLIDGVPQNEAVFGGWSPDEAVRVDNIERIEVIRGPGSALYGGNAYAGVISVITQNAGRQNYINTFYGKFHTQGASFAIGSDENALSYHLSGRTYDTRGYAQDFNRAGVPSTHFNNVDALSGQFKVGSEHWLLDYRYDNYMTEYPLYASDDYKSQRYKSHNLSLQLNHQFDQLLFKNTFYISTVDREFDRNAFREVPKRLFFSSDSQLNSKRLGVKSYATFRHSDTLRTSLGLFVDKWDVSKYSETIVIQEYMPVNILLSGLKDGVNEAPSAKNYAALWQQDIGLFDNQMEVILGARYDNHSIFGSKISSRFGLTWQSSELWSVKLLWGSAYRPPTFLQQYEVRIDNNVPGNPKIKPENIDTSEIELSYYISPVHTLIGRMFNSQLSEFIQSIDGGPYQNTDRTQSITGSELEWRFPIPVNISAFDSISFDVNYTHLKTSEPNVVRNTLNTKIVLQNDKFSIFMGLNALGKRNESDTYHNRVSVPELRSANNKRASVEGSFNVQINAFMVAGLTLGLKVTNVGNTHRFNPTYAPDGYYDVKARPLYYEVKLHYAF